MSVPASDAVLCELSRGAWFSRLGAPLSDADLHDSHAYLRAHTAAGLNVMRVTGWQMAKRVASAADWSRDWWSREQAEQHRLYRELARTTREETLLAELTRVAEAGRLSLYEAASRAAAHAGVPDPALPRAAAGAATHALYRYALALLAGAPERHLFCARFRLFAGGRWPLCLRAGALHVF